MANEYAILNSYHNITNLGYPTTTVVVNPDGSGNYTTIKAAIAGVTPTVIAPIKIYVVDGTYNEIQMDGKDYLTIEGQSRDGVIIVSDGIRTDVDPVSGERYVDMAQADKHGFWIHHNMTLKNMTIRANDVKYCIHSDSSGTYKFYLDNVKLQHSNGFPFGIGCKVNQFIYINDCIFEKTGSNVSVGTAGSHGIYWHNWDDQSGATAFYVTDSNFINCGICYLFELGSDYTDLCKFDNCVTDDETKGFNFVVTNYYYASGSKPPVTDIPYCINLLTIGGTFPTPISYSADDRPNLLDHVSIE